MKVVGRRGVVCLVLSIDKLLFGSFLLAGCAGNAQPPAMFVEGRPEPMSARSLAREPCSVDDVLRVPAAPELHGLPPSGPTLQHRVAPGRSVEALSDAAQVAVAPGHACATTRSGRVACWSLSEVIDSRGSGLRRLRRRAELVPEIENAVSVALGRLRACALVASGEVACWDTGNAGASARPQRVEGVRDARALTMMPSSDLACAVTARRTLACWGPASFSLPDFPSGWDSGRAVEHPSLADVRGVALSQTHYCVLYGGGRVECAGFGSASSGITGAHQVIATDGVTCVITRARGAACWGDPSLVGSGQLASASFFERPRDVVGLTGVAALSAGTDSICALLLDGTARCWGRNATGGLGDGTLERRVTPTPLCNARAIVQLAAGTESCAVFGGGSVRCWGDLEGVEYD